MESICSRRYFSPLYVHITTDTVFFPIGLICLGQNMKYFVFMMVLNAFYLENVFFEHVLQKMKFHLDSNVNIVIFDVEY